MRVSLGRSKLPLLVALVALAAALVFAPGVASGSKPDMTVRYADMTVEPDGFQQAIAECLPNEVATGGGFQIVSVNPDLYVEQNAPLSPGVNSSLWRWAVALVNPTEVSVDFTAFAMCQSR
jgi:cell division septation protein DedD